MISINTDFVTVTAAKLLCNFNVRFNEYIKESGIFSKELPTDFKKILAEHNKKGKRKRTRW